MRHRLLITGCGGRLGRTLSDVVETEQEEEFTDAVFATRDEIDITDYWRMRAEMERIAPTVVVNCAAYANVDGCETDRELAGRINDEGARGVARAACRIEARVIHISTDLVFDGSIRRPHREDDPPGPLSHYAATKLAGERGVAEENPDHTILRSSWFYGPRPADRYPEVFLTALREGRRLRMVSDRIGSPTYLRDLSRAILRVVRTPYTGILHYANTGPPTSRYHFLKELGRRVGLDDAALGLMTPIPVADWTGDVALRPAYSALDPGLYAKLTGDMPRSWQDTLEEYVRERAA